jgi:hypothetical protein
MNERRSPSTLADAESVDIPTLLIGGAKSEGSAPIVLHCLAAHMPNVRLAMIAPGARVGRGIIAGVPDLFVLHCGIAHRVEIKTPAGELSDPQQAVMAAVLAGGGHVGVARDAEEMLGLLDAWGIPRARRLALRASVAA